MSESEKIAKEIAENELPPFPRYRKKESRKMTKITKKILASTVLLGIVMGSIFAGKKVHSKFLELKFAKLPSKIRKDIKFLAKLNLDPKNVIKKNNQIYSKEITDKAYNVLSNRDSLLFYSIPGINNFLSKKFKKTSN